MGNTIEVDKVTVATLSSPKALSPTPKQENASKQDSSGPTKEAAGRAGAAFVALGKALVVKYHPKLKHGAEQAADKLKQGTAVAVDQLKRIWATEEWDLERKSQVKMIFPAEEPGGRRVVAVVRQADFDGMLRKATEAEKVALTNPHVFFLPVPWRGNVSGLSLQNILNSPSAVCGAILVQNPYDHDSYEDAAAANELFGQHKLLLIQTFCMLLGAKRFDVTEVSRRDVVDGTEVALSFLTGIFSGNVDLDHQKLDRMKTKLSCHARGAGAPPDVLEAKKLLERGHLTKDQMLQNLLENRVANQIAQFRMLVDLQKESRSGLTIAADVAKSLTCHTGVKYKTSSWHRFGYRLNIEVEF